MTNRSIGRETMISRRAAIAGALAVAACGNPRAATTAMEIPPLKSLSSLPIGSAVNTGDLVDPDLVQLLLRNISQVTPGWEMKMSAIVGRDGSFRFTAADTIVAFAADNKLALHGHTLVWYKHIPEAFVQLSGNPQKFASLYRDYILAVAGRYRGKLRAWDVLNEPVNHNGVGLRESSWSQVLGMDEHMVLAFAHAAEADPATPRFINEYGLEEPGKRATFMRLVERLLKRGALIDGIGTQTHIKIDLPKGAMDAAIKDLASFGLPIHMSELDISFGHNRLDVRTVEQKLALQSEQTKAVVDAYLNLPARQRYALTLWGLRDRDSWLRQPPFAELGTDRPLPFDDEGRSKPMAHALADALRT